MNNLSERPLVVRSTGGAGGGLIVATGTPSDVAASPESITGRYLAEYINRLKR